MRPRLAGALAVAIECSISLLAVSSVWLIGSRPAIFLWFDLIQIGVLLVLWGLKAVVEGRVLWRPCAAAMCLTALCLVGILQVVPMPRSWVAAVSPAAVKLRETFTPPEAESGRPLDAKIPLSLDPGESRVDLLQLIAWVALFAAVRNNLGPAAMVRFAWLMTANGVLLAIIGMGQLAGPKTNLILWTFPSYGPVFGPFITRTHGADYLNFCLGLGLAMFAATRSFLESDGITWRERMLDPRVTWLTCCLGIMFAGLMATLSRGGLACFVIAAITCLFLLAWRPGGRKFAIVGGIGGALVVTLAAVLVYWQLPGRFAGRVEQTKMGEASFVERFQAWERTAPLVAEFPIVGSGQTTYGALELRVRPVGYPHFLFWNHAHNEYLEAWIEGGTIALLLVLATVAIVLRRGYQAIVRHGDTELGRLALGSFLGVLALVLHCFVDFGLRTPAVAILAAIVGGILLNLADTPKHGVPDDDAEPEATALGQVLSLVQLAACVALAFYLVGEGWRVQLAERYWLASRYDPDRLFQYAKAAADVVPERSKFDVAMGGALMEKHAKARFREEASQIAALVLAGGELPYPAYLGYCRLAPLPSDGTDLQAANDLFLRACQKSPLNYDAHEGLERLSTMPAFKEFQRQRLDRLVRLSPSQPYPWFHSAGLALKRGDKAEAFVDFRNALLAKRDLLPLILQAAPQDATRDELLTEVLRGDPKLIFDAAKILGRNGRLFPEAPAYYQAILELLAKKIEPLADDDVILKARSHLALTKFDPAHRPLAIDTLKAATLRSRSNARLHLEFAKLLADLDDDEAAMRELALLQALAPNNPEAAELRKFVGDRMEDAQRADPGGDKKAMPADEEKIRGATVRVVNDTTKQQGMGVAVQTAVANKAFILTAAHGIPSKVDTLEVRIFPGKRIRVPDNDPNVVKIDSVIVRALTSKYGQDLALLEIDIPQGFKLDGLALAPGKGAADLPVTTHGYWCMPAAGPGRPETIHLEWEGVSRKNREQAKFWKSDHKPAATESGSPIVDDDGRLIGICSGEYENKGYYVHLDEIREFLRKNQPK